MVAKLHSHSYSASLTNGDRQYLFTVNAGSNTVSMFFINPEDPWNPQLVGIPAATLGETPITVAYSPELKTSKAQPTLYIERHSYTRR